MEKVQQQQLQNPFHHLDVVAKEVSTAFTSAKCRHGFVGGYATSLIGGTRMTDDLDIIVDEDPAEARNLLLQANSCFKVSQANKLIFVGETDATSIELLRGGHTRQLKLPEASTSPLHEVTHSDLSGRIDDDRPIPILHPSVLVLTKTKRWAALAESTRPKSLKKARGDIADIEAILIWLKKASLQIDFVGYPEKPKGELVWGVRKLYQLNAGIRPLLECTMDQKDFGMISC